jgi:hypothetical protein
MIDMKSLFDLMCSKECSLEILENLIKRYFDIVLKRDKLFLAAPNSTNFIKARASFDEIYSSVFRKDLSYRSPLDLHNLIVKSIEFDEKLLMDN